MTSRPLSVIAVAPAYNEGGSIDRVLRCFAQGVVDQIVVVSDGSTDDTAQTARAAGAHVITNATRMGCGPAIRIGFDFALQKRCDVIVVFAGNGKDDPRQIDRLLKPIQRGEADFVQGSRYLDGGHSANMPLHRKLGTRIYSFLFSCLSGRRITDGTNGFRAFRTDILRDPRINVWQDWLNNYEVESYVLFQAVRCGYRFTEVGVSKLYPPRLSREYTKMRPFWDWWSHFRPAVLLRLGIKK